MSTSNITQKEELKYSKFFSTLFCSASIIALSALCLLNNIPLDIYGATSLLKVVTPACACFWLSGFVIGKILDSLNEKIIKEEIEIQEAQAAEQKAQEEQAYELPSMFAGEVQEETETETEVENNEFGAV